MLIVKILIVFLMLLIGAYLGFVLGDSTEDITIVDKGIDPDELIAWIENYTHNYEFAAPPTTGEIIRKIRSMKKR